jgi:hypothetical protein
LTVTASLASTLPIKTNNSYDIGSSTLGLASVYLGAPSSRSTRLRANQSLASSITLVLPGTDGDSGDYMESDGSGNLSFVPIRRDPAVVSNYGLTATVASNALTIALKGADGNDPSSSNPIQIVHRDATAATGTPTTTTVTAAMSIVVPDTALLGHASGVNQYVWVYLIMGSSTEIAVAGSPGFDDGTLQSATAITTGADDGNTLYATSNHTSKPVRLIGRLKSNQATAGTWATAISEISLLHRAPEAAARHEVVLDTDAGAGSTNTKNRNFTNISTTGTAITGAVSATNGATITVNEDGVYAITWFGPRFTADSTFEITKNTVGFITPPSSDMLTYQDTISTAKHAGATVVALLRAGDVIRFATFTASLTATNTGAHGVHVVKVS